MDTDTLELMKVLQAGPHDEESLAWLRDRLRVQMAALRDAGDQQGLADLVDLLEGWAQSAPPALAAAAYVDCAHAAEDELADRARAAELYTLAIDLDPENVDALEQLQMMLVDDGQHDRLEAVLTMQSTALAARPDAEPEAVAYVWALLGFLHAEHRGDLGRAVEAYERALDACADIDTMSELAGVYMMRAADGDAALAAELYCALGDVLEGEERVLALQLALDNEPDHTEAIELLEATLDERGQGASLIERWRAYLAASPDGPGAEGRRRNLAHALIASGEHEEALEVLRPLCAEGNEIAQHMRENILQGRADAGAPIRPSVPASRSGHTQVGFRLPGYQDSAASRKRLEALSGVGSRLRASLGRRPSDPPPRLQPTAGSAALPASAKVLPEAASVAVPGVVAGSDATDATDASDAAWAPALVPETIEQGSLRPIALPAAARGPAGGGLAWEPPTPAWRRPIETALGAVRGLPTSRRLAVAGIAVVALGVAGGTWISAGASGERSAGAAGQGAAEDSQETPGEPGTDGAAQPSTGSSSRGPRVIPIRKHAKSTGGAIGRGALLRAIRRSVPRVERCYRRALKRKPELSGRMNFSLRVERSGKIAAAKRSGGSIVDAPMARCAVNAIERTRFPKPKKKAAEVSFRLRFRDS